MPFSADWQTWSAILSAPDRRRPKPGAEARTTHGPPVETHRCAEGRSAGGGQKARRSPNSRSATVSAKARFQGSRSSTKHGLQMHFNVDARPAEIPPLLRRFTEIAGALAWRKRQTDFERQIHDNPLIDRYLDSYFPLERAMIYVRQYTKHTGGEYPESTPHCSST